jgi:hypothetical protein
MKVKSRKPPKEYNASLGGFMGAFSGNPFSYWTPKD